MSSRKKKAKDNSEILDTWKEISDYLDKDIRTCQRWEREENLPVSRYRRSSKSRVFAYKKDLDVWLTKRKHSHKIRFSFFKKKASITFLPPLAILLFFIALIAVIRYHYRPWISDFIIDGSKIVLLDESGDVLGSFDTKLPRSLEKFDYTFLLSPPSFEQVPSYGPFGTIVDIGEKTNVFIFTPRTHNHLQEDRLICLSSTGKLLWAWHAGRKNETSVTGHHEIPQWMILDFVIDLFFHDQPKNKKGLLLLANSMKQDTSQVALLSMQGQTIGELIHRGSIRDYTLYDMNDDGEKELLVVGMNGDLKRPYLAALQTNRLLEINSVSATFKSAEGSGRSPYRYFLYYLLFPVSGHDFFHERDLSLCRIKFDEEKKRIVVRDHLTHFYLDKKLRLQHISMNANGRIQFADYVRHHPESMPLSDILNDLKAKRLESYDGKPLKKRR